MILIPDSEVERMSEKVLARELGARQCERVNGEEFDDIARREGLEDEVKMHHIKWTGLDFTRLIFTQTYFELNGVHVYHTYLT